MPTRGRKKKRKNPVAPVGPEDENKTNTLVVKMGRVGETLTQLRTDLRLVMEPHTASRVKERNNTVKDYIAISGEYHISTILMISNTVKRPYLQILKPPQGPTLVFELKSYSLMRDIEKSWKNEPYRLTSPLVVLSGFPNNEHGKVMSIMLQNMFPPLNVQLTNVEKCKRVIIFSYNKETELIEFRHYRIHLSPLGVTKTIKKLAAQKLPKNLNSYRDISDYILGGVVSDSEGEDDPSNHVQVKNWRRVQQNQYSVRLKEIGPRMTLDLLKILDGPCDGKVLYHKYIQKTPEEIAELDKRKQNEKKLKEQRKKQQELNVKRKRGEIENGGEEKEEEEEEEEEDESDEMDEEEIYRAEVGEDPEPGSLKKTTKKRTSFNPLFRPKKKNKKQKEKEEGDEGE